MPLVSVSVFNACTGILLGPADLPLFDCLMAWYISFLADGSVGWLVGHHWLVGYLAGLAELVCLVAIQRDPSISSYGLFHQG